MISTWIGHVNSGCSNRNTLSVNLLAERLIYKVLAAINKVVNAVANVVDKELFFIWHPFDY